MRTETLSEAAKALSGAAMMIDEELCINLRGRLQNCNRCAERCPSDALALSVDAIELDLERCTACGSCTTVCPAGSLRLSGFSPRRLLQSLEGREEVHLHCTASRDSGGGTVVPCFQGLDGRLYGAGAGYGVRSYLLHGLEQCEGCDKGDAREWVEQQQRQLVEWFGAMAPKLKPAQQGEAADGERVRSDQVQVSRRGFLKLAVARVSDAAASWLVPDSDPDDETPPLPFFQGGSGQRQQPVLLQTLLAEQAAELPWVGRRLPWTPRGIDSDCTGCLSCGERCPTGALQAVQQAGGRSIRFDLRKCTDCRLCEQVCPMEAIVRQQTASQEQWNEESPKVLMQMSHRQCTLCNHPYLPGAEDQGYCPTCQNEQDLDDEWIEMLS